MINKLVFFSMTCDHCRRRLVGEGRGSVVTQDFGRLTAAAKEAGWKLIENTDGQKQNICPACARELAAVKAS